MATSFPPAQLDRFRREAKKLSHELTISHSKALDLIAYQHGFKNWSLLVKHSEAPSTIAEAESSTVPRKSRERYYLHGDLVEEGGPNDCYCARCDLFLPISHFQPTSYHQDGEDGERFLSSLARWNKLTPSQKGNRDRPVNAKNVLQQAAEAARTAHEASRSTFHKWLEGQRHRNDPVGDLANDAFHDNDFPHKASTLREVENYLWRYGDDIIRAARSAWRECHDPAQIIFARTLAKELDISVSEANELVAVEPEELTNDGGDITYGYQFDFTGQASPELTAKLLEKYGSLRLTVGPWLFDA